MARRKRNPVGMDYMTTDIDTAPEVKRGRGRKSAAPPEPQPIKESPATFLLKEIEADVSKAYSMSHNAPVNRVLKRALDNIRALKS